MRKYRLAFEAAWIDEAIELYREAGLGAKSSSDLLRAMQASFRVVTCWEGPKLCGIGRLLSDGVYYASVFDVAVRPSHQRQGIGSEIMRLLEAAVPGIRIYLTSTLGNEEFYVRMGYKRHRTAFAKYPGRYAGSPYLI